jgi:galactokinase
MRRFLTGAEAASTVAKGIFQENEHVVNIEDLQELHRENFVGVEPRILAKAPGRVNLIGEHTDYCQGLVLPIAMSHALYVTANPSAGNELKVRSTNFADEVTIPADIATTPQRPDWANYVRGMVALLLEKGIKLQGGNMLIHSDVPIGGGVSSSAALEIGTGLALLGLAGTRIDPVELALIAQKAEHEFAMSPCGIMDQFICLLGKANHALLLDCRTQEYDQIPLPFNDATIMVMNTQVKHELGSSEYPVRQRQCNAGLEVIQANHPEVASLRDVTIDMLQAHQDKIEPVAYKRCRHVVSEIKRTKDASIALRQGDIKTFGRLMYESHASLRDDHEVSCTELDRLVEVMRETSGVYGARMTGGGFGGCAIALVESSAEEDVRAAVKRSYDSQFDTPADVYTTDAAKGAEIVPL